MNKINEQYIQDFVRWNKLEGNSKQRIYDVEQRLRLLFKGVFPNKDFKKLTREQVEDAVLDLRKRYYNFNSMKSHISTLGKFIRVIYNLDKSDSLPKKFKSLKMPNDLSQMAEITRLLEHNISPQKLIELCRKNCLTIREKFLWTILYDGMLRPHELLRGKRKNILFENGKYYYKVPSNTKTGARLTRLILCVPYVEEFLETLPDEPETPLVDISLRRVEYIIKRISDGKLTPYVLRRSGITFKAPYLSYEELKSLSGTTQFKHYVKIKKEQIDLKIDKILGEVENGNGDYDLKKLKPNICMKCHFHSDYDKKTCRVCGDPLGSREVEKKKREEEFVYKLAKKTYEKHPELWEECLSELKLKLVDEKVLPLV
jgi:integrase